MQTIGRVSRMNIVACALLLCACGAVSAEEVKGIVSAKPAEGRFVDLGDGRFMVPYTETVPGTDVTFEMVPIPGGKFLMGSPETEEGRNADEGPQFTVIIEPLWMGQHEVTWSEYHVFMGDYATFKSFETRKLRKVTDSNRVDAVTTPTKLYDPSVTYQRGQGDRQPAVTMTPLSARQYTKWLSLQVGRFYRLPCEAEWEYAARAGTSTAYYFGDVAAGLDAYAVHSDNALDHDKGIEVYRQVGGTKPNAWGLFDMYGNVFELVLDQYEEDHYKQFAGKMVHWKQTIAWPTRDDGRVHRGGSCVSVSQSLRSAARDKSDNRLWKKKDPNFPESPWWYASEPSVPVGMRIIRPLNELTDDKERYRFWEEDVEEVTGVVRDKVADGRGVVGLVDPELSAVRKKVQRLEEEEGQKRKK